MCKWFIYMHNHTQPNNYTDIWLARAFCAICWQSHAICFDSPTHSEGIGMCLRRTAVQQQNVTCGSKRFACMHTHIAQIFTNIFCSHGLSHKTQKMSEARVMRKWFICIHTHTHTNIHTNIWLAWPFAPFAGEAMSFLLLTHSLSRNWFVMRNA